MSSCHLLVCDRSELTSVDSLTTPVKSYVVAGCRLALSTPSAGTTTLRATRYREGRALCDPQIRLSGLDLYTPQPLFGPKDCRVYPTFHNTAGCRERVIMPAVQLCLRIYLQDSINVKCYEMTTMHHMVATQSKC